MREIGVRQIQEICYGRLPLLTLFRQLGVTRAQVFRYPRLRTLTLWR